MRIRRGDPDCRRTARGSAHLGGGQPGIAAPGATRSGVCRGGVARLGTASASFAKCGPSMSCPASSATPGAKACWPYGSGEPALWILSRLTSRLLTRWRSQGIGREPPMPGRSSGVRMSGPTCWDCTEANPSCVRHWQCMKSSARRPQVEALRKEMRARGVQGIPRGSRASTRLDPHGLTKREARDPAVVGKGTAQFGHCQEAVSIHEDRGPSCVIDTDQAGRAIARGGGGDGTRLI